jgi:K+-transporting ATPase ATPase C chain
MKLIIQSIRITVVFTILTGLAYPLIITGLAQLAFRDKANGSLVRRDGKVVGSELLAQKFQSPRYFWPRPSADDYATVPSGASNLGPTSAALRSNVTANAAAIRAANKLPADARIPSDLLFASGSGLDPHISPDAARLQVARVAAARNVSEDSIKALVEKFVEPPQFGFLGEPRVNVLLLNLALDQRK